MNVGKRARRRRSDGGIHHGSSLGELVPNRLSIDLRPNELSILTGPTRPASPLPDQRSERPRTATSTGRRSRTGLSTLLFIGFVALWILPRIADFLPGGGAAATTAPEPVATAQAGEVVFGAVAGPDCTLGQLGDTFAAGSEVWWAARFAVPRGPDEQVTWRITRGGTVVEAGSGPSDRPAGTWDSICAGKPLTYATPGAYRFAVNDASTGKQLAVGQFELR